MRNEIATILAVALLVVIYAFAWDALLQCSDSKSVELALLTVIALKLYRQPGGPQR